MEYLVNMHLQRSQCSFACGWFVHTVLVCIRPATSDPLHFCLLESSFYLNLYAYMHSLKQKPTAAYCMRSKQQKKNTIKNNRRKSHHKNDDFPLNPIYLLTFSRYACGLLAHCPKTLNSFIRSFVGWVRAISILFGQQHKSAQIQCLILPFWFVCVIISQ